MDFEHLAQAVGCLLWVLPVVVLFWKGWGSGKSKYKKPRASVIDGQTIRIVGDIDNLSRNGVAGAESWEHTGYKSWKLHILTTHTNPNWHDEAQAVADDINRR